MKKINVYILLAVMLFPCAYINAQMTGRRVVSNDQPQVRRDGNNVTMSINLNLNDLNLGSQEMVIVTPELRTADNAVMRTFQPVIITGGARDKALKRAMNFGKVDFPEEPQVIVRDNEAQTIPLVLNVPYQEGLHTASLYLKEDVKGCACEDLMNGDYNVLMPILPMPFVPTYELSYVTPPVEEVKQRSETHSAHLNYVVGRYELKRDFKDNATVLNQVDRIIREIQNDQNLTVNDFTVTGYASPEGNYESNMKLSENRAKSFVSYLQDNYGISPSSITTDWKGEDWEGLRKAVAESNVMDKQQVLDIIDTESDIPTRENKIKRLSGGETYRILLRDYYPPLRRNDYTITYVARGFSVDEAKQLIRTKPQHLSLNEMFLVANTYPKTSNEFKEVFDIAARLYPNDPIPQVNTAAWEIETGNMDGAIQRLQSIDTPEAWNNLGIIYANRKDYQRAEQYFNRASSAGLRSATLNRDQLLKVMNEQ